MYEQLRTRSKLVADCWSNAARICVTTFQTPGVSVGGIAAPPNRGNGRRVEIDQHRGAVQAELGQQWFTRWIGGDRNREHSPLRSNDWTPPSLSLSLSLSLSGREVNVLRAYTAGHYLIMHYYVH